MVNILIIVLLNISTSKINDLYSIVIKNNIEYNNIIYTVKVSSFIKYVFPYILSVINIILIFIFVKSVKSEKEKVKWNL